MNVVLTCPQLGHGAFFDINAVPQLPQNPPPPPLTCLLCGAPHEAHVVEPVEIIAPQLVQVLTTNEFDFCTNKDIVLPAF